MEKSYSVYCHTTPSGRRYVGISCSPKKRWNDGKGYKKNYIFWRAICKYGWENIKHEILFSNLTSDEATLIEKRLVKEWKLTDPKYGLNIREGGADGKLLESSRRLMSEKRKGNTNCVGRTLSSKTKQNISESLKDYYSSHPSPMAGKHLAESQKEKLRNRQFSNETRRRMSENHCDVSGAKNPSAKAVAQYDMNGTFIKRYDYAKLACDELSIDLSSVIKCCKGKAKSCGGYIWKYA